MFLGVFITTSTKLPFEQGRSGRFSEEVFKRESKVILDYVASRNSLSRSISYHTYVVPSPLCETRLCSMANFDLILLYFSLQVHVFSFGLGGLFDLQICFRSSKVVDFFYFLNIFADRQAILHATRTSKSSILSAPQEVFGLKSL